MTIRHGSRPSKRMNAVMKIGTVGISPISAMQAAKPAIQPKNKNPRVRMTLVGRCAVLDAMSMWIFFDFSARTPPPSRSCRPNTSLIRLNEQNRIAPVPTMVGMMRAANDQSNDAASMAMNRHNSAPAKRFSGENIGWPHCETIFFRPPWPRMSANSGRNNDSPAMMNMTTTNGRSIQEMP